MMMDITQHKNICCLASSEHYATKNNSFKMRLNEHVGKKIRSSFRHHLVLKYPRDDVNRFLCPTV